MKAASRSPGGMPRVKRGGSVTGSDRFHGEERLALAGDRFEKTLGAADLLEKVAGQENVSQAWQVRRRRRAAGAALLEDVPQGSAREDQLLALRGAGQSGLVRDRLEGPADLRHDELDEGNRHGAVGARHRPERNRVELGQIDPERDPLGALRERQGVGQERVTVSRLQEIHEVTQTANVQLERRVDGPRMILEPAAPRRRDRLEMTLRVPREYRFDHE